MYKGYSVIKDMEGNYVAQIFVNDYVGSCEIKGATQKAFKDIFNEFIKDNGGLKKFQEVILFSPFYFTYEFKKQK